MLNIDKLNVQRISVQHVTAQVLLSMAAVSFGINYVLAWVKNVLCTTKAVQVLTFNYELINKIKKIYNIPLHRNESCVFFSIWHKSKKCS